MLSHHILTLNVDREREEQNNELAEIKPMSNPLKARQLN